MKCSEALEQMLVAEPSELRGGAHSALARHVAGCPRCVAVAARIAGDTELLASALAADAVDEERRSAGVRVARSGMHRVRGVRFLQAGLAAAALALVSLPFVEREQGAAVQEPAVDAVDAPQGVVAPSANPVAGSSSTPSTSPAARTAMSTTAGQALDLGRDISRDLRPYEPVRFAAVPQPVVSLAASDPAAGDPVPATDPPSGLPHQHVTVVPEAGERALVARTSDPRITVVWLYR